MRVTPEQALNLPDHFCLASWIAGGARSASFIGQTYPFPPDSDAWARPPRPPAPHASARTPTAWPRPSIAQPPAAPDRPRPPSGAEVHGSQPRRATAQTARPPTTARRRSRPPPTARRAAPPRRRRAPATVRPTPLADRSRSRGRRSGRCERGSPAPPAAPNLADSPVRRRRGPPAGADRAAEDDAAGAGEPARARVHRPHQRDPAPQQPAAAARLPRLYDEDYAILALLDRAGLVRPSLIGRAVLPGTRAQDGPPPPQQALRARPRRPRAHRRARTHAAPTAACRGSTRSPATASRSPSSASRRRSTRSANGARSSSAAPARSPTTCTRSLGDRAAPRRRRPRHRLLAHPALRHRPLPGPPDRHRPQAPPDHHARAPRARRPRDLDLAPPFREIKPDVSLELRIPRLKLTFDLLVELDLTGRASYNREKFLAYDAFLTGWALAHPRYRPPRWPAPARPTQPSRAASASWAPRPTTGTSPAATTSSSPSSPTSTTSICPRSRSRRCRPDCASGSPASETSK